MEKTASETGSRITELPIAASAPRSSEASTSCPSPVRSRWCTAAVTPSAIESPAIRSATHIDCVPIGVPSASRRPSSAIIPE